MSCWLSLKIYLVIRIWTLKACLYTLMIYRVEDFHLFWGIFSNKSRSLSSGAAIRPATVWKGGLFDAFGCALKINSK